MIQLLQEVIGELSTKEHVGVLLQDVQLQVKLVAEEGQETFLIFNDGGIQVTEQASACPFQAIIQGDEAALQSLLLGELKLREAMKTSRIQIQSSFRNTLFLESFFYLLKPYPEEMTELSKC